MRNKITRFYEISITRGLFEKVQLTLSAMQIKCSQKGKRSICLCYFETCHININLVNMIRSTSHHLDPYFTLIYTLHKVLTMLTTNKNELQYLVSYSKQKLISKYLLFYHLSLKKKYNTLRRVKNVSSFPPTYL